MKQTLVLLVILFFSFPAFSNVERYISPESISVSGTGTYGDEYNLTFSFSPSTKGVALGGLELTMVYGKYYSQKEELVDIYNPIISTIEIANDAGFNGSFYTFTIRYGELLSCNRKMKLQIKQPFGKDSAKLELKKIDPCNGSS